MKAALAAASLVLLAAGTACGERSEPVGASVHIYPITVTDASDRQVTVHRRPTRIAALSPAGREILSALSLRRRLVGPPEGFFGVSGQLVVSRLRKARPDLIVASPETDGVERRVTTIQAPVYFTPHGSIDEVERAITQLGLLTGRPVAARRLVHRIAQKRSVVETKLAGVRPVSVFVDTGFFITVPDQSLIGDVIHEARGVNVAGANPEPGPFDLGDLARRDPSVFIATSDSETTLADLRKDRRTRQLRAVRQGRFHTIDASLLEPGPLIGDGLLEIARLLHPDAFR